MTQNKKQNNLGEFYAILIVVAVIAILVGPFLFKGYKHQQYLNNGTWEIRTPTQTYKTEARPEYKNFGKTITFGDIKIPSGNAVITRLE